MFPENDSVIFIIIAILLVIIGGILWHLIRRIVDFIIIRFRFKRGKKGESIARKYLRHHGFSIIGEQVTKKAVMMVNEKLCTFEIRVDFIVRKKEITGVVEVKTGKKAVNPLSIPTRRQLFEYYHVFLTDVVYLFNADTSELQEITFMENQN